jgi:RNA polymerase sigma factor (TIGR02999 family)
MHVASDEVTQLLGQLSGGNRAAVDELLPLVYKELKRIAGSQMSHERPGHTLQATALVHEAYLKLVDQRDVNWRNRAHFFGVAAQAMRRIMLDYAKARGRGKRGGGIHKTSLDEAMAVSEDRAGELLDIDEALTRLEQIDARQGRIVELRFFCGLSVEETAEAMGISSPTVKREWAMAKAWLHRELTRS